MTGRIFDIQRFCIHDGPGIRTTVFLKGCFLHCKWCHNPESISPASQLSFIPDKCIGCGECVKACPKGALAGNRGGKAVLGRSYCDPCPACSQVCDAQALELVGRDAAVEEVLAVVLRDRDYYAASGGGLTLSGGEPMFQPEFAEALLRGARTHRLHTCVETSGFAEWKFFERLLPLVDLFLYDWKETDPQLHESFTGKPNQVIRENLRRLHEGGARILVRCPVIPEYNARKEHLDGIAALSREMPRLLGVELLAYHRLGRSKLRRFGFQDNMPESVRPPEAAAVRSWIDYLRRQGVRVANAIAAPAGK